MGNIKKLAGATIWYGVPTILHRFLGFILQLFLTSVFPAEKFGEIGQLYAFIPFCNIIFTYGLETSYFRFTQSVEKDRLYNTLNVSMIVSTVLFSGVLLAGAPVMADVLGFPGRGGLVMLATGVLFFDTLTTIPFAKLRQEGRPRKFAAVKLATIVVQIVLTVFILKYAPKLHAQGYLSWYDPDRGVEYFVIANMIASACSLLFLSKEFSAFRWKFDKTLWKEVIRYSWPLIAIGLGGMINEMLSRLIFPQVYPADRAVSMSLLGIFSANYKLAVLITISIQAFRMGAEPFFFNQSDKKDAPQTYARVMKYFTMFMGAAFLAVALFLELWQWFITRGADKSYAEGIQVVPVLAMASVFLGIYYNLTIWYKLTDRNLMGVWITLGGALVTIVLNIWWIPQFSYTGSAWATFVCYGSMMAASYLLGQKYYPVPYEVPKILGYLGLAALIFVAQNYLRTQGAGFWPLMIAGVAGMGVYLAVIAGSERKDIGRLLSRKAG